MKLLVAALALFVSSPALAHWHYNEHAGFGIYQPEGWEARVEGRSSRLTGPATDHAQSALFLGSDWVSSVKDEASLARYAHEQAAGRAVAPHAVSELPGFRVGDEEHGAYFVLRQPENVIVVEYDLRGSRAQIDEGQTMLGSIEIRTRGIEN